MGEDPTQKAQALSTADAIIRAKELEKAEGLAVQLFTGMTNAEGLPHLTPTLAMQLGAAIVAYASSGQLQHDLENFRQAPAGTLGQFDDIFTQLKQTETRRQERLATQDAGRQATALLNRARAVPLPPTKTQP